MFPSFPPRSRVLTFLRPFRLNFFDVLQAQNKYQLQPPLPFVLGTEFAGVVSKDAVVPKGCSFKAGDRVFGAAQGSSLLLRSLDLVADLLSSLSQEPTPSKCLYLTCSFYLFPTTSRLIRLVRPSFFERDGSHSLLLTSFPILSWYVDHLAYVLRGDRRKRRSQEGRLGSRSRWSRRSRYVAFRCVFSLLFSFSSTSFESLTSTSVFRPSQASQPSRSPRVSAAKSSLPLDQRTSSTSVATWEELISESITRQMDGRRR